MSFCVLIPPKHIPGINPLLHIIQERVISVSNDTVAASLELLKVIYNHAAKECTAVLQCRLIYDNSRSFRFEALHNTLDAALAEVIAVALHGQAIYAYSDIAGLFFTPASIRLTVSI